MESLNIIVFEVGILRVGEGVIPQNCMIIFTHHEEVCSNCFVTHTLLELFPSLESTITSLDVFKQSAKEYAKTQPAFESC